MLIRKLFKAEMAHMVPGAYTTRCHYLHGHSYRFELFLASQGASSAQMVADFKLIKDLGINDFFDSFDHAVMVWERDRLAKKIASINPNRHVVVPFIPTAEMMAKAFFVVTSAILNSAPKADKGRGALVHHVIVHETDTGYASFGVEDLERDEFPTVGFHRWRFSSGVRADWKNRQWFDRVTSLLSPRKKSLRP